MKLGILKADDVRAECVKPFGEYPDMFVDLLQPVDPTMQYVIYEVQHEHYPENIDDVDAYLITGSKASVYDNKTWIYRLCEFIQQLDQRRKKCVGICFGHQMIAQSLGGKTQKSDKGWGLGVHSVQMTEEACQFAQAGQSYRLLVSHQDQVVMAASGATILAKSEFCPIAMSQLGDHILTFQGHPEFVHEYSKCLLNLRRKDYTQTEYQHALQSLESDTDQQLIARWIVDFIRS